jgi:hypothetical protein
MAMVNPRFRRSKQHATQATEEKHTENTGKSSFQCSPCVFFRGCEGAKVESQVHALNRIYPAAYDRIIYPTSESRLTQLQVSEDRVPAALLLLSLSGWGVGCGRRRQSKFLSLLFPEKGFYFTKSQNVVKFSYANLRGTNRWIYRYQD